jgi:hypothetical protein
MIEQLSCEKGAASTQTIEKIINLQVAKLPTYLHVLMPSDVSCATTLVGMLKRGDGFGFDEMIRMRWIARTCVSALAPSSS